MQLASGIYYMDTVTVAPGETLEGVGRVIITRADGKPPHIFNNGTIRGVWIGGTRETLEAGAATFQCGDNAVFDDCAFFGYFGGLNVAGGKNARVAGCVFANCGTDNYWHPVYINNYMAQAGEGTTFERNIIVGGEGYAIHLWHSPTFNTLNNNFVAAWRGMAQQGDDNVWTRNVFWSNGHYPCVYIDAGARLRFTWNLVGAVTTTHILNIPTDAIVRNNGFISPAIPFGKSPQSYDNVRGLLGYSQASITNSVTALTASFGQTPQALLIDTSIDANVEKLSDVLAHWSVAA